MDTRAGSQELIAPLKRLGVEVEPAMLASGDIELIINGPEGRPVVIGIEYKKLGDLFQCMRNGRFADQLRKMKDSYEVSWLLIEGRLRGVNRGDKVQTQTHSLRWYAQPGGITYQEIVAWTLSMCMAGGVLLWRTESQDETVEWLRGLEIWGTGKEWEQHRAHIAFYTPESIGGSPFEEPGLVEKVAVTLPRIGATKAVRVAEQFDSVREMINASEEEWRKIHGIGKKDAATIVGGLRGPGKKEQ